MQYHLDTIPVWEAMEAACECPLCELSARTEADEIERALGGSVMEPDVRIHVNELGICARHHQQLYALQNRLGHTLLTDSHSKELLQKLERIAQKAEKPSKGKLFGRSDNELADELAQLCGGCVICEQTNAHMTRYLQTFVHLWKTDEKFREAWQSSKGACLPHTAELLKTARKQLNDASFAAFAKQAVELLKGQLTADEKDLEWFTLKFDYRNAEKPWGNAKNALERTVNRLRGRCLGDSVKKS